MKWLIHEAREFHLISLKIRNQLLHFQNIWASGNDGYKSSERPQIWALGGWTGRSRRFWIQLSIQVVLRWWRGVDNSSHYTIKPVELQIESVLLCLFIYVMYSILSDIFLYYYCFSSCYCIVVIIIVVVVVFIIIDLLFVCVIPHLLWLFSYYVTYCVIYLFLSYLILFIWANNVSHIGQHHCLHQCLQHYCLIDLFYILLHLLSNCKSFK